MGSKNCCNLILLRVWRNTHRNATGQCQSDKSGMRLRYRPKWIDSKQFPSRLLFTPYRSTARFALGNTGGSKSSHPGPSRLDNNKGQRISQKDKVRGKRVRESSLLSIDCADSFPIVLSHTQDERMKNPATSSEVSKNMHSERNCRVGGGAMRRYPPFGIMGIANAPPILRRKHGAASCG